MWLDRVEAYARLVRDVQTPAAPGAVADTIVEWLAEWLPLPCWAVAVLEPAGTVRVLAARGLTRSGRSVVLAIARRARQAGGPFWAVRDVRRAIGFGPATAALAFVLVDRTRPVAALVGLDDGPARETPHCGRTLRRQLALLFPPMAYALDVSMHLERVQALSVTDELTGLYNARYLRRALAQEVTRSQRTGRPVAVLFGDLDHFKRVNDTYGHLLGDQALAETADLLRGALREGDVFARLGGDEFAAVLPDTDEPCAVTLARRFLGRGAAHTFLAEEPHPLRLTISMGIVTRSAPFAAVEALLKAADQAMYWVKAHGRNDLHVAAPGVARVAGEEKRR
ncbi:MAG: diguanylate cyclase [Luteitalea sp.]|nr:diguanylate cyclase [Luteitalea sp.]